MVGTDGKTTVNDISRYFNMENKKRAYQASWIRNIMASRGVWEVYGRPPQGADFRVHISVVGVFYISNFVHKVCKHP